MQKLEEFLNDVLTKNIFSHKHYQSLPLSKKIEIIKLLNEYYKLKYNFEIPKKTIYIDWDGVVQDTMEYSKKLLKEQYGIDYDTHDRNNVEADKKVEEFFINLDWFKTLKESPEINSGKTFIKLLKGSVLYHPIIYSAYNSKKEKQIKASIFNENLKDIDYILCQSNQLKQCDNEKSILIDDNDFYLKYYNGIPIRFISNKPTIFPTIDNLGEIYFLFPIDEQSLDFKLPSIYSNYERVMCPKLKRLKWIRRNNNEK